MKYLLALFKHALACISTDFKLSHKIHFIQDHQIDGNTFKGIGKNKSSLLFYLHDAWKVNDNKDHKLFDQVSATGIASKVF